jgi:hypothetical protein
MPLPPHILPRLDPLIRRLATDHDGEVIATVRALCRVLAAAGSDFHDLADRLTEEPRVQHEAPHQAAPSVGVILADLLGHPALSLWETEFITSVSDQFRRRGRLSEKQISVLTRIWQALVYRP